MLLLRIVAVLTGIGICGAVFLFFLNRDRRFLMFAWRLFRWALVLALVFFGLLILERVLVPFV